MKKLIVLSAFAIICTSCTKDKEKIYEKKNERSADHMRNNTVDSARLSSETGVPTSDSATVKDSSK